jgi:UDP-GlcNAc:undecaprenyl-phosphate GlcNAc-1-phosphate transferase
MVGFLIHYSSYFLVDIICLLAYFKVAFKYNIIDKPNERSSHKIPIIRGGGIIFIISFLIFNLFNNFPYPWLFLSVMLSGFISFVDDVKGVSNKTRLGFHLISIILFIYQAHLYTNFWLILPLFILLIGIINAYNFMDGINGITGFYSLSILLPFLLIENSPLMQEFILAIIVSLVIFLYFNARKKAVCFAGDIGSISIALLVVYVIIEHIVKTGNYLYITALLIYGLDSIFTIIQRLYCGENIFEAHRKHLYQYLANEFEISHLWISVIYAILQLGFNIWLLLIKPPVLVVLFLIFILAMIYIILKIKLIQRMKLIKQVE